MPRRPWPELVGELSNVGKLVHLAMRMDQVDENGIRSTLLRSRRRAFEDELEIQAGRVGCKGARARLTNGAIISELEEQSRRDAQSIVSTYNYDLSVAIAQIRADVPTANRYVYAKRLQEWRARRAAWKDAQIAQFTDLSARSLAQFYFNEYNRPQGTARLEPRAAVCPICQGWIARGEVPAPVAAADPPPYHPNCPHTFVYDYTRFSRDECTVLWMGE